MEAAFKIRYTPERKEELSRMLLENINNQIDALKNLHSKALEYKQDCYYRFYHQSFKVFSLQEMSLEIFEALKMLLPKEFLNEWFVSIVRRGTGLKFEIKHNSDWLYYTLPILQAFDQCLYFLHQRRLLVELMNKY